MRFNWKLSLLLMFVSLMAGTGVSAGDESSGAVSAAQSKSFLQEGGVFIFYDPSCPICREYFPTIERLSSKYNDRFKFFLVLRSGEDAAARTFVKDYHPTCKVLVDSQFNLQKSLGATVVPQSFVVRNGNVIYSGRIDDRYESIGRRRTVIKSNDLEIALSAADHGATPAVKHTTPIGCFLENDGNKINE